MSLFFHTPIRHVESGVGDAITLAIVTMLTLSLIYLALSHRGQED